MSRKRALRAAILVVIVTAFAGLAAAWGSSVASVRDEQHAGAPLSARQASPGRLGSLSARTAAAVTAPACNGPLGLVCTEVVVPIDRMGALPGTITLHVESLPAEGAERGVMMLVAGGPGQGSATVFDIGAKGSAQLFRALFPGYRIVAFDNRGTGKSGLLNCPALQRSTGFVGQDSLVLGCATSIGPTRDFYSTHDHADDTEAVRQALGVEKIAMWGISYGTKLALAYASAYPTHVERILLDSVLPTDYPEPYQANVLHDMPLALSNYCGISACRAATTNYAGDVTTVANALARIPAKGSVRRPSGTSRTESMGGLDMLSLVVDSDLNPGLAALLPAATHAARTGDMRPLLRLHDLDSGSESFPVEDLSVGLNAATSCVDGHFPWERETPVADRPARLKAAVAALPVGALGAFGPWATELGTASFCLKWPSTASPTPASGTGPLPDVPVLAVSGGYDMRTPTSSARDVIAGFPHGQLLVVPSVGHSTVTADPSICALRAVRAWIDGDRVPASCARAPFIVRPVGAYPAARRPSRKASPRATLSLVDRTIREAEAVRLATLLGSGAPVAGLTSGRLTVGANRSFRLQRYGIAPGVELSGRLRAAGEGLPDSFEGTLTVTGARAVHGTLRLKGGVLSGTLGG